MPHNDTILHISKVRGGYKVESNLSSPLDYIRVLDLVTRNVDGASAVCTIMVKILAQMTQMAASDLMATMMAESDNMRNSLVEDDE